MITPQSQTKERFMDVDKDDHTADDGYLKQMQDGRLEIIKDKIAVRLQNST